MSTSELCKRGHVRDRRTGKYLYCRICQNEAARLRYAADEELRKRKRARQSAWRKAFFKKHGFHSSELYR